MKSWDVTADNANEIWDIFDKNGDKLPYTKLRKDALLDNEYHLVVRVWLVNSEGQILLSQRGINKRGALLWECTAGSALSGESSIDTIKREVLEELSIDLSGCTGTLLQRIRRDDHHDFYEIWIYEKDICINSIQVDGKEVIDVRWVSILELERMISEGLLMPTLSSFPQLYRDYLRNRKNEHTST